MTENRPSRMLLHRSNVSGPPLCAACGHPLGSHRYNGARFTGTPKNLDCIQCDCREFVEASDA